MFLRLSRPFFAVFVVLVFLRWSGFLVLPVLGSGAHFSRPVRFQQASLLVVPPLLVLLVRLVLAVVATLII